MTSPRSQPPAAGQPGSPEKPVSPTRPVDEHPGTNEVEHEPDPAAEPLPDGHHKYVPASPYTTGNQ